MNLAELLGRAARVYPNAPAVYAGDRLVLDYRGLASRAMRIGAGLRKRLAATPGTRVGIWMANIPEYLEVLYGIWAAGMVAVPINAKLHPKELRFIVDDCSAAALFASADLASTCSADLAGAAAQGAVFVPGTPDYQRLLAAEPHALVDRGPTDLAWLFYTSGTTGRPKGVMLSNRNLLAMTACYFSGVDRARHEDAVVYAAPFSHGAGLYNLPNMVAAARHVVPESGGFDPAELCALTAKHRDASFFAAPTMVQRLVDHVATHGGDTSGMRTIVYGGGPMYVETISRALSAIGNCFVQIYGQGESPMTITVLARHHFADREHPRHRERLASVGIAQALVEVRVVDAGGDPLPADAVGEIVVRGDSVMEGYWQNPAATTTTIRNGWLWTGDMGALDADGFLTLKDRSKDVIISGGANIYPREVEEVLLRHPAVHEASVVGRPHAQWGEEVVAFVVARPGTTIPESDLDQLCLDNIARFKRPRAYRFVTTLPKNNYGKVLKTELRRLLGEERGGASMP